MAEPKPIQLFHAIADSGSARARALVGELELHAQVEFRNVFYAEAEAAHRGFGGTMLPALWDGRVLHQGEAAVLAALRATALAR